jgi:hypothetical protein
MANRPPVSRARRIDVHLDANHFAGGRRKSSGCSRKSSSEHVPGRRRVGSQEVVDSMPALGDLPVLILDLVLGLPLDRQPLGRLLASLRAL